MTMAATATPVATTPTPPPVATTAPATPPPATPPAATSLLTPAATTPGKTDAGGAPPAPTQQAATTTDKSGEGTGEQGKPAETPVADVEFKLPPGVEADAVLTAEFKPLLKELGLKSEAAQKLVDLHLKAMTSAQQKASESTEQQVKQWMEKSQADKEFGGKDWDANLKIAQRAFAKFGTPELSEFLASTGLGNHPELIRSFYRIGKANAEDSVAGSTSAPSGSPSEEARLAILYPSMSQK